MRVRLDFSVSEKALPALIAVRTMGGKLILYEKVYRRRNSLCFCTESENLIITVVPFNADYYEKSYFLKLPITPCVRLRLSFDFSESEEEFAQDFYLYDANYFFPIKSATLNFFRKIYRL